jgi:dihydrofolate reductase
VLAGRILARHERWYEMRKVFLSMQMSIDGYVAKPDGDVNWAGDNLSEELMGWVRETMTEMDTMLLGRVSFLEQASFWPTEAAAGSDMTPLLNDAEKVVFSSSLGDVSAWPNSRIVSGDMAAEVRRLKAGDGKSIFVSGGATLAQTMSSQGLIDEYRLYVHPVVLGTGMPLFTTAQNLTLVSSHPFANGVVGVTYIPR